MNASRPGRKNRRGQGRRTVFSSAPTRVRAPLQAYSHYYWEKKIKAIVRQRWEKALIEQGEREENDTTPLPKVAWGFQTSIVKEMYEAESQEFKDQLDARRNNDKVSSVALVTDDQERRKVLEKYQL